MSIRLLGFVSLLALPIAACGSGGAVSTMDAAGSAGAAAAGTGAAGTTGAAGSGSLAHFSFFETGLVAMRRLSKSQNGFGGDLRYGETSGLAGVDKICTEIAETSMPGAGAKGWHAFLSAAAGPAGQPVNAIDRIGNGPWYDRRGRVVAHTKAALLNPRPMGADPEIADDLPNEDGVPNHRPDPTAPAEEIPDNPNVLTGSDAMGRLYGPNASCQSWTSSATTAGRPASAFPGASPSG